MDLELEVDLSSGQHSCAVELNEFKQTEAEFEDVFTPTEGQTEFELSHEPDPEAIVRIYVNGVLSQDDFSISGSDLTFTQTEYSLGPTDKVAVLYN